MTRFPETAERNKDTGLLKQVRKPLILTVLLQIIVTTLVSSILVLNMSARTAMKEAANQAQIAARKMDDYKALEPLVEYWLDNCDDIELVYDRNAIDMIEEQFRANHPEIGSLKDVGPKEFGEFSDADRKLYAEMTLGKLSGEFDDIKRSFAPKWLFCFVIRDGVMRFLVTGTLPGEVRASQGGDIYELGTDIPLEPDLYPHLNALISGKTGYDPNTRYSDLDSELGAAGSWAPIVSDGRIIAIVGSSRSYVDMLREWIPVVAALDLVILLSFVYLEIWIVRILKKRVINPVMTEEATIRTYMDSKDTAGTVAKLKQINTGNEVESLAVSFYQMIEEIERYVEHIREITAESERIGAELNVARKIQADMLPNEFPPYPDRNEFEIYASMEPAKEVGGDFYDFFFRDDDHLVLVIGDVSGKGVPAALIMAISKNLIRNIAFSSGSPSEILSLSNKILCDNNENSMFVTLWIGIVEISTGHVISGNAGHEHPAMCRGGKGYELDIYDHDMPLGIMEEVKPFSEQEFDLKPGDSIFVYTDGVPEAVNADEEFFGTGGMLEVLNTDPGAGTEQIVDNVKNVIGEFSSGTDRFDDMTMISFKYLGGSG